MISKMSLFLNMKTYYTKYFTEKNVYLNGEMAPKLRNDAEIRLLGNPRSDLSEEWMIAIETDSSTDSLLPFKLPAKLSTRGEVTKLYWYLRQLDKYCHNTKQSKLADIVVNEVMKYWTMSNIITIYQH